jgi:hypothetical protein
MIGSKIGSATFAPVSLEPSKRRLRSLPATLRPGRPTAELHPAFLGRRPVLEPGKGYIRCIQTDAFDLRVAPTSAQSYQTHGGLVCQSFGETI